MNENELMGQMKISKAVAKMAVPSVISSLVTVVYNMADTFFVGQTGDPLQVAAVSLTNPIFILMMAFANMFGMGGSAVLSMALGAKNEKRARQTSAFVTYASLIVGILSAVILIVFMDPILSVFGANAETYEFAKGYTFYISFGAPFIIWSAAATALYFLFREQIIRLFISDKEVISYGIDMLVAYMLSGPVIGFLFVNMNCMQSVGRALPATILSVLRQGILLIPLLYLLRALFGLNGVILGQSVTDYIAVILSVFLWRRIRSQVETQMAG